jgi:ABC-type sugar transport system permease subunit
MALPQALPKPANQDAVKKKRWRTDKLVPYLFISPFIISFIILFLGPALYSLVISFFRVAGYGSMTW